MLLNAFAYLMLATQSCRGSIWDKDEKIRRRYVFPLFHSVAILGILELLVLLIVIFMVMAYKNDYSFNLGNLDAGEIYQCVTHECNSTAIKWKIISSLLIVLIIFLVFNGIYKVLKYSMFFYRIGKGMYHLMKLICCCCRGTIELMDDTGELVDQFFPAKSIVPTDVFAGLTYLHAKSKHDRFRMSDEKTDGMLLHKISMSVLECLIRLSL